MEDTRYLDKAGLSYFASKIKKLLLTKVDKGDDNKIVPSQLPDNVYDVVEFQGIIDDATSEQVGIISWDYVVWVTAKKCFMAVRMEVNSFPSIGGEGNSKVPKYYNTWSGSGVYQSLLQAPYSGKIFIDTTTNRPYRWDGKNLVEVSASLALGETADTAYPGNKGKQLSDDAEAIKEHLEQTDRIVSDAKLKTVRRVTVSSTPSSVTLTSSFLDERSEPESCLFPVASSTNAGIIPAEKMGLVDNLSTNESSRIKAESDRQSAESDRAKAEQTRTNAETDRVNAERLRTEAERQRASAEQTRADDFRQQTEAVSMAIKNCVTATEGAEKVNASLSEGNVLTVTDRDGQTRSVDLASQEDVASVVDDVRHLDETMGAYTERESITLTAAETNKAVSADGVKVTKQGWAIAEFTAEKGNVYLFKPGVTDGSVCIFAEKITSVETRGIDYTYTYNEDGTTATATATYLGKTHTYTYTWGTDAQGNKTATITEDGAEVAALPMTYETQVGTYAPLVRLNADAELPKDGYCRYMSHFKGNSAIKIAVSYKIGSADLVMKVTRDGVLASISTQLGNLSQKEDETRNKMEEYHRSYINLLFKEDWTVYVDGKAVKIPGGKKMKVYPLLSFQILQNEYANLPLQWIDITHLDVSTFTDFRKMFTKAEKVTSLDVSGFDTHNVTSMSNMFYSCRALTSLDVSGWDTSSLGETFQMFYYCSALQSLDLTNWDMSKNVYFLNMFAGCGAIRTLRLGNRFFTAPAKAYNGISLNSTSVWTDSSVRESLVTNSYERRANGLDDLTLTLHANTKKVLTEDDIATMTAKGYIIA